MKGKSHSSVSTAIPVAVTSPAIVSPVATPVVAPVIPVPVVAPVVPVPVPPAALVVPVVGARGALVPGVDARGRNDGDVLEVNKVLLLLFKIILLL